jgi:hypothetical protein
VFQPGVAVVLLQPQLLRSLQAATPSVKAHGAAGQRPPEGQADWAAPHAPKTLGSFSEEHALPTPKRHTSQIKTINP